MRWNFRKHMQIEKAPVNQENIDSRCCKCSQHNQYFYLQGSFFVLLCCEYIQQMSCKIAEVVFLIFRRFFFYFYLVELSRPP